jgi:superfamily II DNA/RNA helicase
VTRLLEKTPKSGQRMLFSATLDRGVKVLVDRFLSSPVTHSVDSEQSPVSTMVHHVLHVRSDDRLPILVDLASAPGKVVIFTRMKHRAKQLAKKLNDAGVPAVEMHGNLSQPARVKNLAAFSEGRAVAMVATDIAARGIHVDDVTLVIHADPPLEHKAYLHRSGRTARAGNEGTVVTLAADSERKEVAALARAAGIMPTTTQARHGDPILSVIAPGERVLRTQAEIAALFPVTVPTQSPRPGGGARRSGGRKPAAKPGASAAGGRPGGGARGGRPQGSGNSRPSSGGSSARRGAPRPR